MSDLSKLHNLAGQLADRRKAADKRPDNRWYRITNQADLAVVHIYDMIGDDGWGGGVTAKGFADELRAITAPVIEVHINSEGGEVFDGVAIYETLKQHPARIEVCIDSLAASAASFIAMAGDTVKMAKRARMMIHDAGIGGAYGAGNAKDLREFASQVVEMADLLDDMSDNIAAIYADKAGGTPEDWRAKMTAETWYSAEKALLEGLIDEIMGDTATQATPVESTTAEDEVDASALLAALKGAWDA